MFVSSGTFSPMSFDEYRELESRVVGFLSDVLGSVRPQYVVLVQRKGERIFRDIFHHHALLSDGVCVYCSDEIGDIPEDCGRVLILDDSVRAGESVSRAVDAVRHGRRAEVYVATLITNVAAFERVEKIVSGFFPMEVHEDETAQSEHSEFIFQMSEGSGIRFGTGYPGLEIMSDAIEFGIIEDIVRGFLSERYGILSEYPEDNRYKKARKVTYMLSDCPDDGICTSDQKVFLHMDVGINGMLLKVEFLINPASESMDALEHRDEVSDYVERSLATEISSLGKEMRCGLEDHGCQVRGCRIRHSSENRQP